MNREKIQQLRKWLREHERALSAGALALGFVIDNLTLRRIDLLVENLVLLSYLGLAGCGIWFIVWYDGRVRHGRRAEWLRLWAPLAVQFAFGALFSGFVVFYSRSASWTASWPFLLFLAAILVGNESFRRFYARPAFQLAIFYLALFSMMIYQLPLLLNRLGASVFLLSGLASLLGIGLIIHFLRLFNRASFRESRRPLLAAIAGIYLLINLFYFADILPPIPLSLQEIGVYYSVSRAGGGYLVTEEVESWRERLRPGRVIHVTNNAPLYVYAAVFAPTRLSTGIVHDWQYYNEQVGEWQTKSRVSLPISGGRDGGYRSYSQKSAPILGLWRVDIETSRGQIIGRVKFKVEKTNSLSLEDKLL